jgi:ectoine hydroxylase-related dioxygenase (phytanoyl-CoA dioxygenase family)
MLTEDQRRRFVREGYLAVEDAVDSDLIAEARGQFREALPEDLDDEESLVGVGSRSPDPPATEPLSTINERLYEYAAALVGSKLAAPEGPGMQFAFRYPGEYRLADHVDRRPQVGHLDGYGPGFKQSGEYGGFTVGAVVYFDDVVERGGGFTVWPGTHWAAAEYFTDHALNCPGAGGTLPAVDDDGGWDSTRGLHEQVRSVEVNQPAGTVVLWHNKLLHTAGENQSQNVRMAGIQRFSREDHDEIREDAADKPFRYWEGVDA